MALLAVPAAGGAAQPGWLGQALESAPLPHFAPGADPQVVPDQQPLANLEDHEAWQLLRREFPGPATGGLQDPGTGRVVERYVGNNVARVIDGGERRVLVSTVPLRARRDDGSLAPTQLSLTDRGSHHEPVNAPFELRIPDRGAGEITLGSTPRDTVTITPHDRATGEAASTPAGRMFWAATARDTDTLVAPTSSGAETFEQLRGPEAPERFEYALGLPDDARLEPTGDGGFAVSRDGDLLMRVAPPVAVDAAGRDVPARLEQTETGLALAVDHRRDGVAYPVLADPQWISTYSFIAGDGFHGWFTEADPVGSAWYHVFGTTDPNSAGHPEASGLWIIPRGNKSYHFDGARNTGPLAMAFFEPPGNGTISRVIFSNVRYSAYEHPSTGKFDGQSMRLGVCCSGGGWPMKSDFVGPNNEVFNQSIDSGWLPGGVRRAMFWLFTSGCGLGNDCTWAVPASNQASWAQVGGVQIFLEDPEAPTVWHTGPLATRGTTWVNAATGPLSQTLHATDPTSGLVSLVSQAQLRGAGYHNAVAEQAPCDGHHHTPLRQGAICAQEAKVDMTWDPRNLPASFAGWVNFRPYASDYAGNATYGGAHTVWVDRTPPRVAFSGELWDARDSWLRDPFDHELRLAGTDNAVAGESGVARYRVEYSHQPDAGESATAAVEHDDFDPCPSPNGAVAPPADWQPCPSAGPIRTLSGIDLPQGRNRFRGHVTDHAGNDGQPSVFDVYVDATRPTLELTGTLAGLNGTWGAPEGVLDLTAETTDGLSGLRRLTAQVTHDGAPVADLTDQDLCPAPTMPSLDPCPRTPDPAQLSLSAEELPEGRVQVDVDARDLAGNRRTRSVELHVDRTAPTVELSGEILQLDRGWQDPERPITATVAASDNLSGITAVELWVRDADGREQLLGREQVCDETAAYTGDGAPCPLDVVTPFSIDASRLPDGHNTYFARATEFAGKRARDDLTIYVDNTPPNAPTNLQVAATGFDGATLSWSPGPEPAADAGISHYVVTVVVDGVRFTENISPYPYAAIGGIPPGIKVEFLVKAIDRLHRPSQPNRRSVDGRKPDASKRGGKPGATASRVPCDDMPVKTCTDLNNQFARAYAKAQDIKKTRDAYIAFAAEFVVWVTNAERLKDVATVLDRRGVIYAVNALVRKQVNREGARLLTATRNKALRNLVKQQYRPNAKIGKGSTAEAVLDDVARRVPYDAPKAHYKKAQEGVRRLNKILKDEKLSRREEQIAVNIRGELWSALPSHLRPALK